MSKKSNNTNEVAVETKAVEAKAETPVAEEPKEKLGAKVGNFVKKHGKKIAAGAVVAGGAILGYALGIKKGKDSAADSDDDAVYFYEYDEDENQVAEN